jgi:hypothetical protein
VRSAFIFAAFALAGCGIPGDISNNAATENLSLTKGPAPTPPAPQPESPLVGRWADVGTSCASPVEIFGNGTFRAVDGSRGHWRYEGNQLTITVGARVYSFRVLSLTRDRLDTIDAQGQRGASVRCP